MRPKALTSDKNEGYALWALCRAVGVDGIKLLSGAASDS